MKKLFALLLAGMLLALGACGGEEERVSAPSSLETEGQKGDETATEEEMISSREEETDEALPAEEEETNSEEPKEAAAPTVLTPEPVVVSQPETIGEPEAEKEQLTGPSEEEGLASEESQPAEPQSPAGDTAVPITPPTKEEAAAFIGRSVSELTAALGEPADSSYAASCMGEGGEDGELFYDGFTVYTYRKDGQETVQDVL